ncbi:HXXEE domain-containing protein [Streptomyces hoynatensis]|uniref:HXXEE domain-containing protein n=1 Tax=Streptomyces hoynatensis TaxID=1141874 RepID=A0A3A9ZA07_9ACTN|nr:HXXEE domain-containing protein [Streptomyces hoynatensis]RKN44959.1 HXXEE domain-containing protein [Streptomyces hoynatensis]
MEEPRGRSPGAVDRRWPRAAGVLAMGLGGALALASGRLSRPQLYAALNWGALLVHQFEEYEDPGYFPGQFNRGLFGSDRPGAYPLNARAALWTNTALAYPFYALPVLLPGRRWLGIAPALLGMAQAVSHGLLFPLKAGARYSPGFLAAGLLHVPLGVRYLAAIAEEDGSIDRADWARGVLYAAAFAAATAAPQALLRDPDSPYRFTDRQLGPYTGG